MLCLVHNCKLSICLDNALTNWPMITIRHLRAFINETNVNFYLKRVIFQSELHLAAKNSERINRRFMKLDEHCLLILAICQKLCFWRDICYRRITFHFFFQKMFGEIQSIVCCFHDRQFCFQHWYTLVHLWNKK